MTTPKREEDPIYTIDDTTDNQTLEQQPPTPVHTEQIPEHGSAAILLADQRVEIEGLHSVVRDANKTEMELTEEIQRERARHRETSLELGQLRVRLTHIQGDLLAALRGGEA